VGDSNSSHGDFTGRPRYNRVSDPGEFYMTLDDFKNGFKYYTVTYFHDDWQNSFIEKRSSVGGRLYKFNFTVGDAPRPSPRYYNSVESAPSQPPPPSNNQTLQILDSVPEDIQPLTLVQTGSEQTSNLDLLNDLQDQLLLSQQKLEELNISDAMDLMLDSEIELETVSS
jgi:hypothetical protein